MQRNGWKEFLAMHTNACRTWCYICEIECQNVWQKKWQNKYPDREIVPDRMHHANASQKSSCNSVHFVSTRRSRRLPNSVKALFSPLVVNSPWARHQILPHMTTSPALACGSLAAPAWSSRFSSAWHSAEQALGTQNQTGTLAKSPALLARSARPPLTWAMQCQSRSDLVTCAGHQFGYRLRCWPQWLLRKNWRLGDSWKEVMSTWD